MQRRQRHVNIGVLLLGVALATARGARAQQPPASVHGVPRFTLEDEPLALEGPARSGEFIAELGRKAAVLGDEQGGLEVWAWPLKLVSGLHLSFRIPDYDDPIPATQVARRVVVRPEMQTIVYSHATFTVREHILVPLDEPGALLLLEVETARPLEVLVQMHADFDLAWPGSFGGQYMTWVAEEHRFLLSQGGVQKYNGYVGSPFAVGGTSHPAHDAPTIPSRFELHFEAGTATREMIPIVVAGWAGPRDSAATIYDRLLTRAPRYYHEKAAHYRRLREDRLSIRSPDPALDEALEWAKVNLDQQLACNPDLGCGLVAGFGSAGRGNYRPGFGWYFGGDAAINSMAMDQLGEFETVRKGLIFSSMYQRADGKIPHEISHAAGRLPWFVEYPYTFFHGDTTPFWITACYEYWRASGDDGFIREIWSKLVRAFEWSAATDADGDGLMENASAGAGAIEVGGLGEGLHTDIYLAGVWVAALHGVGELARLMGDSTRALRADSMLQRARASVEREFWNPMAGIYAFALLEGGGTSARGSRRAPGRPDLRVNDALTVWPSTALSFGLLDPVRADRTLERIASADITTDWGTRLLSAEHPLYEPLHYNNGAVWPFMTGFAALAHYRYHRGWAGFELIRDIARTTFDFALGRNPELMSGAYYRTLDTAVPDQYFGTAMMANAITRGLLGLEADSHTCEVKVAPHLPARWDSVAVHGFRTGCGTLDVRLRRRPGSYTVDVSRSGGGEHAMRVTVTPALPLGAAALAVRIGRVGSRSIAGSAAEPRLERTAHDVHADVVVALDSIRPDASVIYAYSGGAEVLAPEPAISVGDRPHGLRLLDFRMDGDDYVIAVEGLAGEVYPLTIRSIGSLVGVRGAEIAAAASDITVPVAPGLTTLRFALPASVARFSETEIRFRIRPSP